MRSSITYTRIIIEGFRSFGSPTVIPLDRVGINLVKGENGKGKSTIFNALIWAEFGVKIKKSVETWEENRMDTYRGTRVTVERTDGVYDYRIVRHHNFKGTTLKLKGGDSLMVFKKPVSEPKFTAEHLQDAQHKSNMQDVIHDQLGVTYKAYSSSVIFGQRVTGLVKASNTEKRKLFEELFELEFVDSAKEIAKAKAQELQLEYSKLETGIEAAQGIIDRTNSYIEEQTAILDSFDTEKESNLEALVKELAEAQDSVSLVESELKDLPAEKANISSKLAGMSTQMLDDSKVSLGILEQNLYNSRNEVRNHKGSIADYNKEIEKVDANIVSMESEIDNVEDSCPYCKRKVQKAKVSALKDEIRGKQDKERKVRDQLSIKLADLNNELPNLELNHEKNKEDHDAAKLRVTELEDGLSEKYELDKALSLLESKEADATRRLATANRSLGKVQTRIEREEARQPPSVDLTAKKLLVTEQESLLTEGQPKLETISAELERVSWWIKKGFSSSGLKAFVFNAMLGKLNTYAKKYADRLGLGVNFSVDLSKTSKPFSTKVLKSGKQKDYEDLSGGQQQRVDLCLAFAMHDLIGHKTDFNIFVTDEGFEGLDNEGVEAVFDLLRVKAESKSVYVITHSDIIDSLQCKSIEVSSDELGNTVING